MNELELISTISATARTARETAARIDRIMRESGATLCTLATSHGLDYLRALAVAEAFGWAEGVLSGQDDGAADCKGVGQRARYILDIAAEKIGELIQQCSNGKYNSNSDRIAHAIAAARFHEYLRAWHLLMRAVRLWQTNRL